MTDKEITINRYREENKTVKFGETVFAGSSLMEMFPIDKLLSEHNEKTVIYNRGVCGFVSQELLDVVDVCITDLKPRKLFINIGTNDLSDSSSPMSQLINTYDAIITYVEEKVPDVKIYFMAYYPVNYEAAAPDMKECLRIRTNEKINAANKEVAKLADKHGAKYIDINKNLKDDTGRLKAEFTTEGLHINENGYRAIYDDIMRYVKE